MVLAAVVLRDDTASGRVVKDRFDVRKGGGDGDAHEEGGRPGMEAIGAWRLGFSVSAMSAIPVREGPGLAPKRCGVVLVTTALGDHRDVGMQQRRIPGIFQT